MTPGLLFAGNFLSCHGRKRGVSEELADRLESRGWSVIRTSSKLSRPLRLIDMVSTVYFSSPRFRLAHVEVYSGPAFIWAEAVSAALRWRKRPYILTLHGGALPQFAERWPGRVRRLIRSASAVTAPSDFLARQLSSFGRAIVLPNAIDSTRYPRRTPIATNSPKLVWLRSFHQIYNPQMAVHVLALLRKQFPDAELLMIGPDDGDGSLENTRELARELGVTDYVRFIGPVSKSEVPNWLGRANVFLNTTNVDNAPVSVVEAMACGLAVVSTNVGGVPDLVEDGKSGLLVRAGDASAMAAQVCNVLQNASLARNLYVCAQRTAARHDWQRILPRWEELFRSVGAAIRQ
ncbi:MAG: glycosyltransferase family 4 protein [Acidobacteriaceae bacterium]|nr:glycosyltransferase family 4 protein [Acidobacteriaceae bacterium]